MGPVAAVLLDAGGVLVGPAGGRWNPRFDFEEVLAEHVPEAAWRHLLPQAIATGDEFLTTSAGPQPRVAYHRVVLAALGITDPTSELLAQLERPVDTPVFEAFPEVASVLDRLLRAGLDLAVVTDSWGTSQTKRAQLAEVGLDRYFAAVVVSEELGCTKPDPRMFDTAAAALGHRRERCLFVDDDPELVRAACRLGYHGIAVVRDGQPRPDDVPVATTLTDLLAHLGLEGKDPDAPSRREVLVNAEVFDRRPATVFDPGAGDLDPEAAAVRDELLDLLRELVATKLTPRQREIVELSFVDGLTQAEIAERLGIRQQVVSKHLFGVVRDGKRIGGAIRRLRQLCEEHGIDPDRWV